FLFAGTALCMIPAAVWVAFLYPRLGTDGIYEVVWANNINRFTGDHDSHVQPFYYYLHHFPLQFMPWSLFLPLAIIHVCRGITRGKSKGSSLYLLAWFFIPFFLLSISAGKRGLYLLPIYPAAALLIGSTLGTVLDEESDPGKWYRIPFLVFTGIPVVGSLALCGLGVHLNQPFVTYALLSIPGVFLGGWAFKRFFKGDLAGSFKISTAALMVLLLLAGRWVFPLFDPDKSFVPLMRYCRQLQSEGARVMLYEPRESLSGAVVFYLERNLPELHGIKTLHRILESDQDAMVLCAEVGVRDIEGIQVERSFEIGHRTYVIVRSRERVIQETTVR
ncbi:MAG: hypothetical protein KJ645_10455, partial [Planctomycetes bacterium]|nr:hypothetical protein [Planctomycetota bacterium]